MKRRWRPLGDCNSGYRCCICNIFRWFTFFSCYFELRTCSLAETHHVRQNIIMLVVGLVPICAVAKQSRPTTKNGCLGVLCRPFCLQPRYYGLPSLLKFDGPTSPGANYEKYDFSENRKVQNPPGWWVFLLTGSSPQIGSSSFSGEHTLKRTLGRVSILHLIFPQY